MERKTIQKRTSDGKNKVEQLGGWREGNPGFGYRMVEDQERNCSIRVPEPTEQKWIQKMIKWHNSGWEYGQIAMELNRLAVPTRRGAKWIAPTVRGIVVRHNPLKSEGKSSFNQNKEPAAVEAREEPKIQEPRSEPRSLDAPPRELDQIWKQKIIDWRTEGRTLKEIADNLNSNGVQTMSGCKWSAGSVHHVCAREPRAALTPEQKQLKELCSAAKKKEGGSKAEPPEQLHSEEVPRTLPKQDHTQLRILHKLQEHGGSLPESQIYAAFGTRLNASTIKSLRDLERSGKIQRSQQLDARGKKVGPTWSLAR